MTWGTRLMAGVVLMMAAAGLICGASSALGLTSSLPPAPMALALSALATILSAAKVAAVAVAAIAYVRHRRLEPETAA